MNRVAKMTIWTGIVLTIVTATAAHASDSAREEERGVYVAAKVSVTQVEDTERTIPGPGITIINPFETGFGGSAAIGYAFNRVRVEGEFGYADNGVNRYIVPAGPFAGTLPLSGGREVYRYMANGYLDLTKGSVRPFVGGGVGIAEVKTVTIGPRAPFPTEAPRTLIDGSDSNFAYQLMAGLDARVSPRLAVVAQYRWFDAGTVRGTDSQGVAFATGHQGHNFDVGVRLRF